MEKKTGGGGLAGFGKLLDKKGGAGNVVEKKGGFGMVFGKSSGNAVEKKGASAAALGKMSLGAFGKKGLVKGAQGDDQHGILEGISSLHSWIKSQTMIKPNQKMKGKHAAMYDEVNQ